MGKLKQPSGAEIQASADLTLDDVRAWLEALASDLRSGVPVQTAEPAKAKEGSVPGTARRRPSPGGEYLGKSA